MARSKTPRAQPSSKAKASARKSTRLGRGLSTLMAQPVHVSPLSEPRDDLPVPHQRSSSATTAHHEDHGSAGESPESIPKMHGLEAGLSYVQIDQIATNPHQPRQNFNEQALRRLAESIRNDGLMQPIIVRPMAERPVTTDPATPDVASSPDSTAYELVAGERRLRAAQLAGLSVLPAVVRELDDRQTAEWALIENLQREDLNPIERAEAFQRLLDQFQLSHDDVAQRVGVERSTVSNCLRMLQLCDSVRKLILDGLLSAGQAKALAGVADPQEQHLLAQRAVAHGWSVRQVEQQVRQSVTGGQATTTALGQAKKPTNPGYLHDLEQQVAQQLQTKVKIRPSRKKGSGTLLIEFYSLDQFDALMQRFDVQLDMD